MINKCLTKVIKELLFEPHKEIRIHLLVSIAGVVEHLLHGEVVFCGNLLNHSSSSKNKIKGNVKEQGLI